MNEINSMDSWVFRYVYAFMYIVFQIHMGTNFKIKWIYSRINFKNRCGYRADLGFYKLFLLNNLVELTFSP